MSSTFLGQFLYTWLVFVLDRPTTSHYAIMPYCPKHIFSYQVYSFTYPLKTERERLLREPASALL